MTVTNPQPNPSNASQTARSGLRTWWREPHFLEKNTILGCTLIVFELVLFPPESPVQMLLALAWLGLVAVIPFVRGVPCAIMLLAAMAVCALLPGQGWWTSGGTAVVTALLAVGYLLPQRGAVAAVLGYAAFDAVGYAFAGTNSIGGSAIRGMIGVINDIVADDMTAIGAVPRRQDVASTLPQYSMIVLVFTFALDLMIVGFLVVFGAAFRRGDEANERAARSQRMLERITREQELAHMIHDSVANDMSTIAMLAWRAKAAIAAGTADDAADGATDGAKCGSDVNGASGGPRVSVVSDGLDEEDIADMLDAIYERSHHALDRVHEVIDVLNGRRMLEHDRNVEDGTETGPGAVSEDDGASEAAEVTGIAPFDAQVEKYVEDQDRAMARLGIRGISRVRCDATPVVPPSVRRTVMNLLEEIYANLVRHCAMHTNTAYSLFVTVDERCVRINEVNALAVESDTLTYGHRHGDGLAFQRAAVESLGGVLHASAQDGAWTVNAEIPLDRLSMLPL
ncbi:hypothetical protein JS533_007630 [Bifidobacterium amazonense]|uniref:Histidine kinase n=1 Tax=Bifidobacterium amazonense TaxID=2809027 RepID=A0ABS9VW07_9BIFI|nr:hypothetical protein [Bifidobacterium amazonense]MCH9276139.1 hypothetical protein [Bifidobacterium amazonense]